MWGSLTWFVMILKNSTSSDLKRLWLTFYSSNQLPPSTLSSGCFTLQCSLSLKNVCGPWFKFPGRNVVVMFLDIRWATLARSQWMHLIFPYRLVCVRNASCFRDVCFELRRTIIHVGNHSHVMLTWRHVFAGVLVGIPVLKNIDVKPWEEVLWWVALVAYLVFVVIGVLFNVFYPGFPDPDMRPCCPMPKYWSSIWSHHIYEVFSYD